MKDLHFWFKMIAADTSEYISCQNVVNPLRKSVSISIFSDMFEMISLNSGSAEMQIINVLSIPLCSKLLLHNSSNLPMPESHCTWVEKVSLIRVKVLLSWTFENQGRERCYSLCSDPGECSCPLHWK